MNCATRIINRKGNETMPSKIQPNIRYYEKNLSVSWQETISDNEHFRLHNHSEYELYIFINGDASFVIEGRRYTLSPYDILFIRPDEMHRVLHNSRSVYKRMVMGISSDFFTENNMTKYEKILSDHSAGKNRKINGNEAMESGLQSIVQKLRACIENGEIHDSPVARAFVIELIYTMCNVELFERALPSQSKAQNVIDYINNNFQSEITLDDICKNVFVSKYHLCRLFKEATGYTVNGYINHKRLIYVSQLCKKTGASLKEACIEAGFASYSNFYRIYRRENNVSPRDGMSKL